MSITGVFNFVAKGLDFAAAVVDSTLVQPEKTLTQMALGIIPKAIRGLRKANQKLFEKSITMRVPGVAELTFLSGADVNALDADGETALHKAMRANDLDSIKWLLEHGADTELTSSSGRTALGLATQPDLLDCAKYLIEQGALWSGNHLLWLAAESDRKDLFELLLRKGGDINCQNVYRETVLHRMAELGNLEWGKYLIQKGASPNIQNMYGITPFAMAVVKMFDNLLPPTQAEDEFIDLLIANDASINTQDRDGETLLHWAVKTGKVEAVKYLLSKGAKNLPDHQGKTPLKLAKARGDEIGEAMLQLLMDSQALKN